MHDSRPNPDCRKPLVNKASLKPGPSPSENGTDAWGPSSSATQSGHWLWAHNPPRSQPHSSAHGVVGYGRPSAGAACCRALVILRRRGSPPRPPLRSSALAAPALLAPRYSGPRLACAAPPAGAHAGAQAVWQCSRCSMLSCARHQHHPRQHWVPGCPQAHTLPPVQVAGSASSDVSPAG